MIPVFFRGIKKLNFCKGREPYMIERFTMEMNNVECVIRKKILWRGLVQSTGQAVPLFAFAIAFYTGGVMVAREEIHFTSIIK